MQFSNKEGLLYVGITTEIIGLKNDFALQNYFSNKKEPITRASKGEDQKHSIASRGVQTIGLPRVLNEVFINTGTPVFFLNACNKS
jgi:hypothetical protein